jgi:hypothetical protein
LRYNADGSVRQRWLCRACGFRFTEPKISVNVKGKGGKRLDSGSDLPEGRVGDSDFSVKEGLNGFSLSLGENVGSHGLTTAGKELNNFLSYDSKRQVCALNKKAKNLDTATEIKTVAGKSPLDQQTLKGKLLEFEFWMQKQGYAEPTVKHRVVRLRMLARRGANLLDPESVKTVIALQKTWCDGTKANVVDAYCCFLEKEGLTWNPPRYKRQETIPFIPSEAELNFENGSLSKEEAEGILDALPIDLSFVDKSDKVKYFNKAEKRIFVRTKSVIGRKVELCHPQKSVHVVTKIIEAFKAGKKDVAEFWINMGGRLVHIRYFAVRDQNKKYLGTLEVTQDLTDIKKIEGEKRLLEWRE